MIKTSFAMYENNDSEGGFYLVELNRSKRFLSNDMPFLG